MAEASPNPKSRKQTRRTRTGSDVGESAFFPGCVDWLVNSADPL